MVLRAFSPGASFRSNPDANAALGMAEELFRIGDLR